ncbi:cytochrome c oxidase subunit 6A1, mitochondrial [Ptiloglossa arizonensis]|uniref:cytochrome c oxidase subunit 6A1, mitochondrial n=1 Tax=Ptiloglossa arizonensis TaxID=3350558 RepID=UPI003F9F254E
MANVPKIGQFGHVFKRNIVKTVEQLSHGSEDATKLWWRITWFVGFPTIILSGIDCYLRHQRENHDERPEYAAYEYRTILRKPFPWGDGKHTLFHSPKRNYIPGVGFEE